MGKKYQLDFSDEALFWTLYCSMVEDGDEETAALMLQKHPEMLARLEEDIPGVEFTDDETAWKQLMERIENIEKRN